MIEKDKKPQKGKKYKKIPLKITPQKNKEDKNKKVRLGLKQNKKSVRFIVEDEGMGFDHNTLPDPTNPKNLEKVKGRGIFLIKSLSDKTTFKQGGRVVEMLFKL